jgi:hypothetical protein
VDSVQRKTLLWQRQRLLLRFEHSSFAAYIVMNTEILLLLHLQYHDGINTELAGSRVFTGVEKN